MSPSPRIRHNAKISNNLRSISFKLPRGEYPNGSEGIRKTWWRSIDRDSRPDRFRLVARVSRGISRIEKIKKKERRREREEKEKKNKGRRRRRLRKIASFAALSNVPFDRSPLSRRFFSRRIYFRWYQSREKIPVGISSLPPSPDEIGFRWSPNVFRYSFLIGSPSIFLLSRYIFSKASFVISPFFFFFKRRRFRAWRAKEVAGAPARLALFYRSSSSSSSLSLSFSLFISPFHPLASPPRGCTLVFRR